MRRADVGGGARMCSYSSCASRCYAGGSGAKQLQSWRLNLFEQLKKLPTLPLTHNKSYNNYNNIIMEHIPRAQPCSCTPLESCLYSGWVKEHVCVIYMCGDRYTVINLQVYGKRKGIVGSAVVVILWSFIYCLFVTLLISSCHHSYDWTTCEYGSIASVRVAIT